MWHLEDDNGQLVSGFDDLDSTGTNHFSKLFKEDNTSPIGSMVDLIEFYTSFVTNEKNDSLKEYISLEALK